MKLIPATHFGYSGNDQVLKDAISWIGDWNFQHYDRDENLIWEDTIRNALANEGGFLILDDVFRADAGATQFYIRLFNDAPVKTDAISDLTGEASGNGYAAQLLEKSATGWPTLALDSGDYKITSSQETFTASGGSFGPMTYAVLTTSTDSSGKLMAYVALSQSITLNDGESLKVTISAKLA